MPELEPRLFSFNNPYGACPECTGLGEKLEVDPELVIPNKRLTLPKAQFGLGAELRIKLAGKDIIIPFCRDLLKNINFLWMKKLEDLPKKIIDIILNGDGDFEGVIPNLERRYHETDSDWTRAEIEQYMVIKICPKCQGKRLKPEVLAVTVGDLSIDKVVDLSIDKVKGFFEKLPAKLNAGETKVSHPILKEIIDRTQFLNDVGLAYLTLSRKAGTLAGGEEQRIRLATQIGSKLSGVLYILDEPSIGLHARDQHKLIDTLVKLKELGNTVVVVEHDPQTMEASDWIVDIGPGAGKHGGKVVFEGTYKEILKAHTLTGDYLSGRKTVEVEGRKSKKSKKDEKEQKYLTVKGAEEHNLKNIDVDIPLGKFVCVTGVSGSGKSSLVNDILAKSLLRKFYRAKDEPGKHKEILGIENLNKVVLVDQSPDWQNAKIKSGNLYGSLCIYKGNFYEDKRGESPRIFSGQIFL